MELATPGLAASGVTEVAAEAPRGRDGRAMRRGSAALGEARRRAPRSAAAWRSAAFAASLRWKRPEGPLIQVLPARWRGPSPAR
jgi:hypothetical protein